MMINFFKGLEMRKITVKYTQKNLTNIARRLGITYNFDGTFTGVYNGYKVLSNTHNKMCFVIQER